YTSEFTKHHFQDKTKKFFFLLNFLMTIVLFNAAAGNLQTLFLFYVLGIPFTYYLLRIRGNHKAKVGAKIFLKQTLYPSIFILLPAIMMTYYFVGNISFSGSKTFLTQNINPYIGGFILFLFIIGLSKNATFPFHNWLPRTFSAPAPVSGLIHSVAAVKTASIAMIKIAVYIFDVKYIKILTTDFFTGGFLIYLCGLTAVYTAYKALKTTDLKQRFTLSTVGQLSYILLAILVGTPLGILAATLHIVTHSIAKSCLFYVAGFFNSFYGTTNAGVVGKLMPSYKFIAVVVAICGLSITGFPFLAGFYSKDLMLLEEYHTGNYASALFLLTGSIINIFYIYPVVRAAFKKPDITLERKPIPLAMNVTFIISIVLILTGNFYMTYITAMID
ncbi:MAG TPA: proton-conducting transporter membrane subunit, partial [Chitinophagales bacterium]|nr:proton-conducting transporter membrane subunit [Chitinophagales bacterium]